MNIQVEAIQNEIKKVIKGKDQVIHHVLCALIAGGHVLLEDIPGVGKTTLAVAISKAMSLKYKRVQFTPDVMPSDVTGFSMYNAKTGEFEFHEGAAMCNLMLADEINRTSPKTQSALLEVMEEAKVTVDGVEHKLKRPFLVLATQNPFGSAGTQRLPESQMDRFMIRLTMGYPSHDSAKDILKEESTSAEVQPVISVEEFLMIQEQAMDVFVDDAIYEMVVNIAEATRSSEYIELGISPRGMKAVLRMAKAYAYVEGRDFVSADDVARILPYVVGHRLVMNSRAKAKEVSLYTILNRIISDVKVPKISN